MKKQMKKFTGEVLEEMLEDVRIYEDYDVLGHLDYVVRYGKDKEQAYSYQKYAELIDEILKNIIAKGKGLELNMAGLKYGLPFAHPHPDILKRYRELGGEIITVGADGHCPEHIAWDFDKAEWHIDGHAVLNIIQNLSKESLFLSNFHKNI